MRIRLSCELFDNQRFVVVHDTRMLALHSKQQNGSFIEGNDEKDSTFLTCMSTDNHLELIFFFFLKM